MAAREEVESPVVALALARGLITAAQKEECEAIRRQLVALGLRPRSLEEILAEKGYLGEADLEGLRREVARRAGEVIPGYRFLARLGRGSMGVVYKAHQRRLDRIVAVKILYPRLSRDPAFVARFLREARTVARLSHPHIVAGYDVGAAGGYHYFVMEYVDGPTVRRLVVRGGELAPPRAARIALQIAQALACAHEHGLVHKDVKPENVLLAEGTAKLCDLGLVGERREGGNGGRLVGTPGYIAPEVIRGRPPEPRSDLYALGATLYFMLTGEPPLRGAGPAATLALHLRAPAPDPAARTPGVPAGLGRLVQRLLAKDPSARYPSAATVVRALREFAGPG